MTPEKWIAGVLASALVAGAVWAVEVPLSVTEPRGVARTKEGVSGGIPFKPGQVSDVGALSLVDAAGKPVPAQFTTLARHADASVYWVLADLLADVPAKGTTAYTLRTGGPKAAPGPPLRINEAGGLITFDTGVVTFTVNTRNFNLFDSVAIGDRKVVTGGRIDLVNCAVEKKEVTSRGRTTVWYTMMRPNDQGVACLAATPTRVKWEYRGPIRATLRVDGVYGGDIEPSGGAVWPVLSYTTRITAWAGSGAVRVQHAVRNADPAVGYDAFIKRAALSLDLAFAAADQGHGLDWAAGGDGAVGLLVQNRHTAGVYRGPGTYLRKDFDCGWYQGWTGLYNQAVQGRTASVEIISKGPTSKRNQGELGFTQDGTFALADRAHKESEVWFDFYTGRRDAAANEARAKAFRSKLILVAPGQWYSETEGLGIGHFGTLADEVATYKKWGWKGWDDEKNYPRMAHQPFAFVPVEAIHDVSEDDCVEGYLLQFLRTGERGFFDWTAAWAGFYRGHAVFRCDWGPRWGLPAATAARESRGLAFGWYGPHMYDWADSRMHDCHHYGRGLFDYYLVTGEVDALETGLDLADQIAEGRDGFHGRWDRSKPGGSFRFGRSFGRKFLTVLSAWRVTRDPYWKKIADHYAALVLKATNWDPDLQIYRQSLGIKNSYFARDWTTGHFIDTPKWGFRPIPPRLDQYLTEHGIQAKRYRDQIVAVKGDETWEVTYLTQVFELSACHMAMERYARLFDSEPMKSRLIEVTHGVDRHYWSKKCQFMIGGPWFGWPDKDKVLDPGVWDASHDTCPGPGAVHSGYATRYTADMFARAYSFSRDPKWLELARRSWNRGSKRLYQRKEQSAADHEVGPFAYIRGAHNNSLTEGSARMFYEVPRAE